MGASNATFGYDFRGFRIITATITALIENHGMGSTPGSRLLFGGCSAGAIGAMNAIDVVAQMTPPGLQVQGLLDAAALVDIDPADNGFSWAGQLQTLQSLVADVMGCVPATRLSHASPDTRVVTRRIAWQSMPEIRLKMPAFVMQGREPAASHVVLGHVPRRVVEVHVGAVQVAAGQDTLLRQRTPVRQLRYAKLFLTCPLRPRPVCEKRFDDWSSV